MAGALNPEYSNSAHLDSVIDDEYWLRKVEVELTPNIGDGNVDGTQSVHVAMTSFHPGQLYGTRPPGGFIPLAHVTTWGRNLWISGFIDYLDSDVVDFEWHIPEPSTLLLGVIGIFGIIATGRRHRR